MRTGLLLLVVVLAAPWTFAADNGLTEQEQKDGWKLLFNGKDLTGWKGGPGWKVEDGAIVLAEPGKGGGFLWSEQSYGDFCLKIEYKFDKMNANSGVYFWKGKSSKPEERGIEMQAINDVGAKPGKNSNGSLYDLKGPAKNLTKPTGEWNQAELTAVGPKITVKLSGETIVEANMDDWTEAGKNPDGSKNKYTIAYKDLIRKGFIALQDHGGKVWYRNIKIRVMDERK
jgi:hypothetical protein